MAEQISLPGFDPAPASKTEAMPTPTDRLFFAVLPDADAIAAIRQCTTQLRSRHALRGHPIIDGRLHISLLGLGDYEGIPELALKTFSHAASMVSLVAFDVCFNRALTFANNKADPLKQKPFVLAESTGSSGLSALQRSLIASLQKIGFGIKAPSSFTPHVTLLYDRQRLDAADVAPVTWTITEFVLVRSQIGDVRRPYDILGRWSLSAQ
jgi:RNA 2',3'-cyclic 3'-phosphodiesterase